MKQVQAAYLKSALLPKDFPKDGRPEIAFAGRSNVGKSSLLNTLFERKALAKTSKTPGKTRTLNFFDVNSRWYFVDLPGYGFAKVAKSLRDTWGKAMTDYLMTREPLKLVVQLIDARHKPTELDHQMLDLLEEAQRPTLIVATKFDKLKASQKQDVEGAIREELQLADDVLIVPFSAVTREGTKELWDIVEEVAGE